MNYGIIENGICINVIIADEEFAVVIGAVAVPEGFGIGDGFIDDEWVSNKPILDESAEPVITTEDKAAAYDILVGEAE